MFAVTAVTYAIIAPLIGYISDKVYHLYQWVDINYFTLFGFLH